MPEAAGFSAAEGQRLLQERERTAVVLSPRVAGAHSRAAVLQDGVQPTRAQTCPVPGAPLAGRRSAASGRPTTASPAGQLQTYKAPSTGSVWGKSHSLQARLPACVRCG